MENGMEKDLFSVAVIDYKSGPLIYETLQSIVMQDYPAIEVLVTNDCSDDFDAGAVQTWLEQHAGPNIKSITVHKQPKNLGTVKNLEWARTHTNGEFFACMASDDAYANPQVFSRGVAKLKELGENAYIVTGFGIGCGTSLDDVRPSTPETEAEERRYYDYLANTPPEELWRANIAHPVMRVAAICTRRTLYDKIGGYDTRYTLLEDYPWSQKLCRAGIRIHWLEYEFRWARYRSGGISNGGQRAGSRANKLYLQDLLRFYELERRPYLHLLTPEERRFVRREYIEHWLTLGPYYGRVWQRVLVTPFWLVWQTWQWFRRRAGYALHRYLLKDKYL